MPPGLFGSTTIDCFACMAFTRVFRRYGENPGPLPRGSSARREPARDLGPSLSHGGCAHEQPEMRAIHDLRADVRLLAADEMSRRQQLFGGDNLVVAGREQENGAAHRREIDRP